MNNIIIKYVWSKIENHSILIWFVSSQLIGWGLLLSTYIYDPLFNFWFVKYNLLSTIGIIIALHPYIVYLMIVFVLMVNWLKKDFEQWRKHNE